MVVELTNKQKYLIDDAYSRLTSKPIDGILEGDEISHVTENYAKLDPDYLCDREFLAALEKSHEYLQGMRKFAVSDSWSVSYWNGVADNSGKVIHRNRNEASLIDLDMLVGNQDGNTTIREIADYRISLGAEYCMTTKALVATPEGIALIPIGKECLFLLDTEDGLKFDALMDLYDPLVLFMVNATIYTKSNMECFTEPLPELSPVPESPKKEEGGDWRDKGDSKPPVWI